MHLTQGAINGTICGQKLFRSGPKEPFAHPQRSANLSLHQERFRQASGPEPTNRTDNSCGGHSLTGWMRRAIAKGPPMKKLLFDAVSELLNAGLSTEQIIALVRQAASAPVMDLTEKS